MKAPSNRPIILPVGYELVTQQDETGRSIFTYRFAGIQNNTWHSRYIDAVDAMWTDVRARATRIATGGIKLPDNMQNTLAYAFGWVEAKEYITENLRHQLALEGYSWAQNQTPQEMVTRLLGLLSPRH
jgi:hypothetical protein